jgi:hypothetical protein
MKATKHLSLVLAGAVAGIALVLSCSDNLPKPADAATCDCPVGEPVLTAARAVRVEREFTVPANGRGGAGVFCPDNSIVMGGGCAFDEGQVSDIILMESLPGEKAWDCYWKNPTNSPINVRAVVRCLKLTPAS